MGADQQGRRPHVGSGPLSESDQGRLELGDEPSVIFFKTTHIIDSYHESLAADGLKDERCLWPLRAVRSSAVRAKEGCLVGAAQSLTVTFRVEHRIKDRTQHRTAAYKDRAREDARCRPFLEITGWR